MNTVIFYFAHNLDSALVTKVQQDKCLSRGHNCSLTQLNPASPDLTIHKTLQEYDAKGTILDDVIILGFCPEDFTTAEMVAQFPKAQFSYFLYEGDISPGKKLMAELKEYGDEKRLLVIKPSSASSHDDDVGCKNSICGMFLAQANRCDAKYEFGARASMSSVDRWMTRLNCEASDLNTAWALRYDAYFQQALLKKTNEGVEFALPKFTPEMKMRENAMKDAMFNTMACRTLSYSKGLKLTTNCIVMRTFSLCAEYTRDAYRRLVPIMNSFMIVSRIPPDASVAADGYLVSLYLEDASMRQSAMRELGIIRYWMEGDMAVGFSRTNPLG